MTHLKPDKGVVAHPTTNSNTVVTEVELPAAPARVWRALTVPRLLRAWLPEALSCEVLAAEPERLLRYRWRGGGDEGDALGLRPESHVTFELTATPAGGTRLRVTHRLIKAQARAVAASSECCMLRRAA